MCSHNYGQSRDSLTIVLLLRRRTQNSRVCVGRQRREAFILASVKGRNISLIVPLLAAQVILNRLKQGGDFVLLLVSAWESREWSSL